ncbi:MAG: DUF2617 family protein [Phototrophicaceae bacterium]
MLKPLKPIIQRPHDLILAVCHSDTLPETTALVSRAITIDNWCINFVIIGESHRVQLSHDGHFVMEEMLACATLPDDTTIYQHSFDDLSDHYLSTAHYNVAVWMSNQLQWQSNDHEIAYTFPTINTLQPITRIQWDIRPDVIHWRTLHTYYYNNQDIYIYSASRYQFQKRSTL